MRLIPVIVVAVVASGAVCSAEVELPAWESSGDAAKYSLGGGLWPGAVLAGEPKKAAGKNGSKSLLAKDAKIDEKWLSGKAGKGGIDEAATLLADRMEFEESVNENIQIAEKSAVEEVEEKEPEIEVLPPIEGELRDLYFAHAPVDFLLDPQHLLTEQKSNDLRRFLEFHSDEARFNIYVLVLGETQEIPANISLQKLHGEWFEENPAVLMVYHRERPGKTQLVYSSSVRSSLPRSVFDRIQENCLREGASTENAPDQVEKISVELSIQLYWLARLMDRQSEMKKKMTVFPVQSGSGTQIVDTLAVESPVVAAALKENDNNAPVIIIAAAEGETNGLSDIKWGKMMALVIGGVLLAGMVWGIIWWRRRDSMNGNPVLFPDCEVSHRLGGEFSGGTFVGMSFEVGEENFKG